MRSIRMIAHRGYSGQYPPNTEIAFIKAGESGFSGAETDVRMTRDGVLVCSHDDKVILDNGTALLVAENDYAALIAHPLKPEDEKYAAYEAYLCPFERYLQIMKRYDMVCFIELKGVFPEEAERRLMETIARTYDVSKCILQSFEFENLVRMHALWPDLPLMFTYGTEQRDYERCFEYGISLDASQCVLAESITRDFHDHGLQVGVWTCNTEESLRRCAALNVDYIESDLFSSADI